MPINHICEPVCTKKNPGTGKPIAIMLLVTPVFTEMKCPQWERSIQSPAVSLFQPFDYGVVWTWDAMWVQLTITNQLVGWRISSVLRTRQKYLVKWICMGWSAREWAYLSNFFSTLRALSVFWIFSKVLSMKLFSWFWKHKDQWQKICTKETDRQKWHILGHTYSIMR